MEMITIPKKEYDSLVKDSKWLSYLEMAGVDNWCGYSFAHELRQEHEGEDED